MLTYHVKTPATSNKTMSKQKGCVDTRKIINKKNNQQRGKRRKVNKRNIKKNINFAASALRIPPPQKMKK